MRLHPTPPNRPLPLATVLLAAALHGACGGGGSGEGGPPPGGGNGGLDGGALTVADFGYESDRPPGFHPLPSTTASLVHRAELVAALRRAGGGTVLEGRDDPAAGHAAVAGLAGALAPNATVLALAPANLDDDADDELVAVVRGGTRADLVALDRGPGGAFSATTLRSLGNVGPLRAELVARDLDRDGRAEFVAWIDGGLTKRLVAVEDGALGYPVRHDESFFGNIEALAVWQPAGEPEVVLSRTYSSGSVALRRYRPRAGQGGLELAADWAEVLPDFGLPSWVDFAVHTRSGTGELDGNAGDELALARYFELNGLGVFDVAVVGLDPLARPTVLARNEYETPSAFPALLRDQWGFTVRRRSGATGELCIFAPYEGRWTACRFSLTPGSLAWNQSRLTLPLLWLDERAATAVGDVDADGTDEVLLGLRRRGGSALYRELLVDGNAVTVTTDRVVGAALEDAAPAVALADFDADGLVVRSTGLATLRVATPIPLVLLSAPPTRAGIDQNHAASTTEYSHASGASRAIEVSTQATVSAYVGYEIEDIFGTFGASGRVTLGAALARTDLALTSTTEVQSYGGAHDADVIVFQGTLYESHEYVVEVAPDPASVGLPFTIDLPVATRTYKWTVPYYNSQVAPEDRIDAALLPHTLGDPASYPRRSALAQELAGQAAWFTSSATTVGQGSQRSGASLILGQAGATTQERAFFVEFEAGFKAGYATAGGSFGLATSHAYTVTLSEEATYSGFVGDILSPASYEAHAYEFGFAVQHVGTRRSGNNVTLEPGATPFQVIRYWVQPTGTAY